MIDDIELEEQKRNLERIDIDEIRLFTKAALRLYGSPEKLAVANRVVDFTVKYLNKKRFLNPHVKKQPWLNVLLSGALLHNIFYNGTLSSLFAARDALYITARECGIPADTFHAICSVIESQLGEDNPVAGCRAVPDSPSEAFVLACWYITEYEGGKEMPVTVW